MEISLNDKGKADIYSRGRICLICSKQFSHYTCPRCNVPYCSVECYKSHDKRCVESFNNENISNILKSTFVSSEDKRKMIEILKRQSEMTAGEEDREELEVSEDDNPDSLTDLISPDDIKFEDLSPEQRKDFERAISDGRISRHLELWQPWWISSRPLDSISVASVSPACYQVSLRQLLPMGSSPSPTLRFALVDLLFSFAFTARAFNGDFEEDPMEPVQTILVLSAVLSRNAVYHSTTESISNSLENSLQPSIFNSRRFSIEILKDVATILSSSKFVMIALNQLHQVFELSLKKHSQQQQQQQQEEEEEEEGEKERREHSRKQEKALTRIIRAKKKLYFFLVWADEQYQQSESPFLNLQLEVEDEYKRYLTSMETKV